MELSHVIDAYSNVLFPVETLELYELLCHEIARGLNGNHTGTPCLVADKLSAEQQQARLAKVVESDHRRILPGPIPSHSISARAFVFISSHLAIAIVGTAHRKKGEERTSFSGGWTCNRKDVEDIATTLCRDFAKSSVPDFPAASMEAVDGTLALAQKLLQLHASRFPGFVKGINADETDLLHVLSILKTISARGSMSDILFDFVAHIARVIEVDRCSIVRVWVGEDRMHVLASHEDPQVRDFVLGLETYPEIRQTLATRAKVIVQDVQKDPLVKDAREGLTKAGIKSLLVVPLVLFDEEIGSLLLRVARKDRAIREQEVQFYEIVAEAAGTALERAHLVEKIETANERLTYLATTDGLTSLYNHRYFRERLDEEFERAKRYRLPLSCIMCDIDDFKVLNDTYGHLRGDSVLREVAKCIMKAVRKSDVVARYGGEEFVVILPQTERDGALVEADRLLKTVSSHHFPGMPPNVRVTMSLGVGMLDVKKMQSAEALLRVTDNALYKAKSTGKNRVVLGEAK